MATKNEDGDLFNEVSKHYDWEKMRKTILKNRYPNLWEEVKDK